MTDNDDLQRFLDAQESSYAVALAEIRTGQKRSHWMWYIFPQCAGLGFSPSSRHFAIASLAQARAYLDHPVLGSRLRECVNALLRIEGRSAREIFGTPDDMKLRSSVTLFAQASEPQSAFAAVLDRFYDGRPDPRTLELIGASQ